MDNQINYENLTKSIIFLTSINDINGAKKLFTTVCHEHDRMKCKKLYFCDKIHVGDATQLVLIQVIKTIRHWDELPNFRESILCTKPCNYDGCCKMKSKCTYIHSNDIIQRTAIYFRYHFGCSFKWKFVWDQGY